MTVLLCLFKLSECVVLFLSPYCHGVCRTQVVDRRMEHESDIYASEEQRLSDDALCEEVLNKLLLHRSWLVRKLCQPSAYGCNPDKVQHRHPQRHFSSVLTVRVFQNPENFQTSNFVRAVG